MLIENHEPAATGLRTGRRGHRVPLEYVPTARSFPRKGIACVFIGRRVAAKGSD